MNKRHLLYIILKNCFSIHPKMRIRNFTKMGEGLQCCISSPGTICNERGRICNVADLPPLGKVCNVADLPGEGLQCCRSSGGRSAMLQIFRGGGGKVCNVADLPGGRSARGKVCNSTPASSIRRLSSLTFHIFD